MPDPAPLLFALAAGTMSASYAVLLRLSAGAINPAVGALIISGVALPFSGRVRNSPGVAPGYDGHQQGRVVDGSRRNRSGEYNRLRAACLRSWFQVVVISADHSNTDERCHACRIRVLEGTLNLWTACRADPHCSRHSRT